MTSSMLQAIAEVLLAIVAIGAIVLHFGKGEQRGRDMVRRVTELEDSLKTHNKAMAAFDKGLALLNQTIGALNKTLESFPCRNGGPEPDGHCGLVRQRRQDDQRRD